MSKRQIKFRAQGLGVWKYGFGYHNGYLYSWGVTERILHSVDPKTLGQYTDRKDENGVEIYEGDRVVSYRIEGVVLWVQECARFMVSIPPNNMLEGGMLLPLEDGQPIFVIGNIHENTELLEAVK